jgi:hypothetical protein
MYIADADGFFFSLSGSLSVVRRITEHVFCSTLVLAFNFLVTTNVEMLRRCNRAALITLRGATAPAAAAPGVLLACSASTTKKSTSVGFGVSGANAASVLAQSLSAQHHSAGGVPQSPSVGDVHDPPEGTAADARPSFSCTALQSAGRTSARPLC